MAIVALQAGVPGSGQAAGQGTQPSIPARHAVKIDYPANGSTVLGPSVALKLSLIYEEVPAPHSWGGASGIGIGIGGGGGGGGGGGSGADEAWADVRLCVAFERTLLSSRPTNASNAITTTSSPLPLPLPPPPSQQQQQQQQQRRLLDPADATCRRVSELGASNSVLQLNNLVPRSRPYAVSVLLYDAALETLIAAPAESLFYVQMDAATVTDIEYWRGELKAFQRRLLQEQDGGNTQLRGNGRGVVTLAGGKEA